MEGWWPPGKAQANTASAEKRLPPALGQGPQRLRRAGELLYPSGLPQEPDHALPRRCTHALTPRVCHCATVTVAFLPGPSQTVNSLREEPVSAEMATCRAPSTVPGTNDTRAGWWFH